MKRWLMIAALLVLGSYIIGYRFLPFRRADRFRNAELFVHTREFRHEWEARLFYPAAYIEWRMIRAHPQPWLPHPSWSTYPQVLLLEGGDRRWTFPLDAFRNRSHQSMEPTNEIFDVQCTMLDPDTAHAVVYRIPLLKIAWHRQLLIYAEGIHQSEKPVP